MRRSVDMHTATLSIDPRFRGPPSSGNGGYVAGLLARELGGWNCVVTLRRPPPLGKVLDIRHEGAEVLLFSQGELIAAAAEAEPVSEAPPPPAWAEAETAQLRYTGFRDHPFPGCFVCGPERTAGDGLRIFPGAAQGSRPQVAAIWTPDETLADPGSRSVRPEFIWAALDCPGYFAVRELAGRALLGRLQATIHRQVRADEPLVVTGWPIESSGRKHLAGTALHNRAGEMIAAATATWVSVSPPADA